MRALYVLGVAGALVGTGLALATGLVQLGAIANLPFAATEEAIDKATTNQLRPLNQATIAQAAATTPPITTTSNAAMIALAKHLKSVGAKMYGAYWCPHCHEQLQLFGQKAVAQLPYIECAEDGKNARPDLCKKAKIDGYPTWTIKGKAYPGTRSLKELATASNYKGSRNF